MNRQRSFLIAFIFVLAAPTYVRAQAWSGILDPTRATDWSTAGAGAIPARTTICSTLGTAGQASTFVQSVTVSQINSALSSCPSGQAVLLNPGTYNTAGGTIMIPSNVTLRGSGPTQTIIAETGTIGGTAAFIQFGTWGTGGFGGPQPSPGTSTAITGGTSQGSTQITVASASGISVGTLLVLTQTNLSYMTNVGSSGTCTLSNCAIVGGDSGQTVQVTAINGNTLTISDPLYIAYTNSPQAYPFSAGCTSAGLENLHLYASTSQNVNTGGNGYIANINMTGVTYSWVKNVESDFSEGSHVWINWSMHNTVRDSFFHDGVSHGPGETDDELRIGHKASANLIENNIFWRMHFSVNTEFGASGNVIAYNYSTGNYHDQSLVWSLADFDSHAPNPMMNLWEGNITTHYDQDQTWGSSNFNTLFRDYSTGSNIFLPPGNARGVLQTGSPTQEWGNAHAFEFQTPAQFNNLIGVIDGSDYLTGQSTPASDIAPNLATYNGSNPVCLGVGYNDNGSGPLPNNAQSTMFYHGFMNCTNGTFQWTTGVTQTLPASFYLSGKPSWWGSVAWPPIGPDITGGNFTDWQNSTATTARGHVNKIPAVNCFNSSTSNGTTNVTTFDANVCYTGSGGLTAPAPPKGLAATVQ
jgi:hypothetical protein